MIADLGERALAFGPSVNGNMFTNIVVIANSEKAWLTTKLQVFWITTKRRKGLHAVILP